ncbi:peptidoglycan-binding protein [Streptomyces alkaliterrae]|uniref:Peptidoglycan-binding protein n=1 Tax=Streptomyces alkaliterrae TaxID=2213162 RepID=A0A5P0YPZ8_9ACTN|nr:peptidoglycan-binding protein [Streptomyces alkaliterrae]MBB1260031.1 peptidoglycan-binding protein [Streptomyces alkaliterrae]MQS01502.1 peptidoglycan-binding protein [Streptomyces alkaliterrae]
MTDAHKPAAAPAPSRPRRALRVALIALAAVTAASAAGLAAVGWPGTGGGTASAAPSGPPGTTKVEQTTLTRTEKVKGTLGHGEAVALDGAGAGAGSADPGATGSSGGGGTLTWLPAPGDTVGRGKSVYRVDERPIPLLYGSIPLYRTLRDGSEGKDVKQLEQNLAKLGYTGFDVDETFTAGTEAALREFQADRGLPETGRLAPGDAVITPGAIRVESLTAAVGKPAGGEVLKYTGTRRVISVDLEVALEGLVEEGTTARVTLPDNSTVEAKVTEVGHPVTTSGGQEPGGGSPVTTIPVELTVADAKKLGSFQSAPVDVLIEAEQRTDVFAVPVTALVALREGGYAVEVVRDGTTAYLPVKTGLFADGKVEISGEGLKAGLVVGVPK